jgi:hypothetical protein
VKCESPTLRGRRDFVHDGLGERNGRGAGRAVGTIYSDRRGTRGDLATVSDNNTDVTVSNQQFNLPREMLGCTLSSHSYPTFAYLDQ